MAVLRHGYYAAQKRLERGDAELSSLARNTWLDLGITKPGPVDGVSVVVFDDCPRIRVRIAALNFFSPTPQVYMETYWL